ncbi:Oxidoreductase ptaL [Hyphodiscus hymeniophilus]|uniref:Oxidoreductase ptaL n=1 Tax=Hyphodiscus hymeniophilus TaxID=353542 RepID=A0A9P6VK11_9HELO|nr:Oxidoreductase ptaL [Hyphodiscus hymeniophilus]
MPSTILILGASYAGLHIAHSQDHLCMLLKDTNTVSFWSLPQLTTTTTSRLSEVSPHHNHIAYMLIQIAIVPGQLADEKVFQEIAPGFAHYPEAAFELIHGTATSLEPTTKTVNISTPSGQNTIVYNILVLATGSRTIGSVPWKSSLDGHETTLSNLHKVQEQVAAAKSIVVGGGGPTGVETAAELAFEFSKTKEIILVTSGEELLIDSMPTSIAQGAESQLVKMGVKVTKGVKVLTDTPTADGKTELALSNGEKMVVDLYLPTIGVIYNTEYVPKALLDERGQVVVDEFLRVKGAQDIWAAGDLTNVDYAQFVYCEKQAGAVAKNLDLILKGKEAVPYKSGGGRILGLSLGRSKATGRMGNMKLPSLVVWWVKGRTLGMENLPKYISGSAF